MFPSNLSPQSPVPVRQARVAQPLFAQPVQQISFIHLFSVLCRGIEAFEIIRPGNIVNPLVQQRYADFVMHINAMKTLAEEMFRALNETTDLIGKERQAAGMYNMLIGNMRVNLNILPGINEVLAYEAQGNPEILRRLQQAEVQQQALAAEAPAAEAPAAIADISWVERLKKLNHIMQNDYRSIQRRHYVNHAMPYERYAENLYQSKSLLKDAVRAIDQIEVGAQEATAQDYCQQFFAMLKIEIPALADIKAAVCAGDAEVEARPAMGCRP